MWYENFTICCTRVNLMDFLKTVSFLTVFFSLVASMHLLIIAKDTYGKIHPFIFGSQEYQKHSQCDYVFFQWA